MMISQWDIFFKKRARHHLNKTIAEYKKQEIRSLIFRWIKVREKLKILKTDCYEEVFMYDSIADLIPNLIIVDISKIAVKIAKKNFPNQKFLVSDICNLPFKDNTFDCVISISTLDNLPSQDVPRAIEEIYRVMKPKGLFFLVIDNRENFLYHLFYLLGKNLRLVPYYQDKCYTKKEIVSLLRKYNFKIKKTDYVVHMIPSFNLIVKILSSFNEKIGEFFALSVIEMAKLFSKKQTKFLTGWFIGILAQK